MKSGNDRLTNRILFRLSGRIEIETDSSVVSINTSAVRGLFAALLLEEGRFVSQGRLVASLWDDPPKSARHNLRGYIWRLRQQLKSIHPNLGDRLRTLRGDRGGYALEVPPESIDVVLFKKLTSLGSVQFHSGEFGDAAATFKKALTLWKGPVGQGCTASSTLQSRFRSVDKLQLTVRERLAQINLLQGQSTELIPELQDLVSTAPFRETTWSLLMRACYLGGDIAGAVTTWRDARTTLAHNYGLEPSEDLSNLYLSVIRRDEEAIREFR